MKRFLVLISTVALLGAMTATPAVAATFTPIGSPDAAYQAATSKIDISGLADLSTHASITDGTLNVAFSTAVQKRTVGVNWATWSSPPFSEAPQPPILFTNGQPTLTLNLSPPVTTFGFELEPNPFAVISFTADFKSGGSSVGMITQNVNGNAGARLFAASVTGSSFDQVVITNNTNPADFAIAQVRYIANQPPDCSLAAPSVDILWPPNHKFVDITVEGVTDPDGDPLTITIDSIFQDEPTDTNGDGAFSPDATGVGSDTAAVRAERAGTKKAPGDGRVYHISFTADDGNGGTCSGTVTVGVPHDVKDTPVDGGPLFDSTS